MSRVDDLQERMIATMPLPEPRAGQRFGRVRLLAAAMGGNPIALVGGAPVPGHETQTGTALDQLWTGAVLQRIDANPTDWNREQSATWKFEAVADSQPGAAGAWLDQWGRVLQVPRYRNETDTAYSTRILAESISPSTTNYGMALLIDRMLGMIGTQVVEGESFFTVVCLNDGGRQNDGGRLMGFGAYGVESLWNTFMVITPGPIPAGHTQAEVADLVDRRRAAGTRLLCILDDGRTPAISTVTWAQTGTPFGAIVSNAIDGSTYQWDIAGGTITDGQGTSRATILPTGTGRLIVTATQTNGEDGGKTGSAAVQVVDPVSAAIVCAITEGPAGDSNDPQARLYTATVPARDDGRFTWTAANGYILQGQGTPQISFALGEKMQDCIIRCTTQDGTTGFMASSTHTINVLPYPRSVRIVTEPVANGKTVVGTVELASAFSITRCITQAPSRIRIYATAEQRDADRTRALDVKISGENHGLLFEAIHSANTLDVRMKPEAFGQSADGSKTLYYTATNLSTIAPLTFDLDFIQEN